MFYVNAGRVSVRVCKVAFLRIHAVSNGRLSRALKSQSDNGGSPHNDKRGKHVPSNKISDEDLRGVKEHIESFPKYQSHYSHVDNPHRHYLSPDPSITTMYMMYKDVCAATSKTPVSEWTYRREFNTKFNLSFGRCVCVCVHAFIVCCSACFTYNLFVFFLLTVPKLTHARHATF